MKKLFLTAIAATMLTAPTLGAQAAPMVPVIKNDSQVQSINHRPGHRADRRARARDP